MITPILIKSRFLTSLLSIVIAINAICLFPFIIVRDDLTETQLNHELIHFEQQKELFIVGFYCLYVHDYLKGMVKYRNKEKAYYRIRFEQEAYANEHELGYAHQRKKGAWKKYVV